VYCTEGEGERRQRLSVCGASYSDGRVDWQLYSLAVFHST
jgi:hypothetical protein